MVFCLQLQKDFYHSIKKYHFNLDRADCLCFTLVFAWLTLFRTINDVASHLNKIVVDLAKEVNLFVVS